MGGHDDGARTRRWKSGSGRSSTGCASGSAARSSRCAPARASRPTCRSARSCWSPRAPRRGSWSALRRWSPCCPARRGSCSAMWADAVDVEPLAGLLRSAGTLERRILRFFPLSEPQIAATLREIDADSLPFEVTTCLRRGELEVATVYRPAEASAYAALRGRDPRAPRRRALLRRRRDDRRGHRPCVVRADGRHGRVLHGRADGGAADRPGRLVRLRARWAWSCTRTRPRRSSRTLIRR